MVKITGLKEAVEDVNVFLLSAIFMGLMFPSFSYQLRLLTNAFLITMMTLSMRTISFRALKIRENLRQIALTVSINYGFLSFIVIFLSLLLIGEASFFKGFIVMAAAPPAILIVAFCYIFKGNVELALTTEIVSYLSSLIVTPTLILLFFGSAIDVLYMVQTLFLLIILPMILSRFLTGKSRVFDYSKLIINACIGLNIYTVIGLNQPTITSSFFSLLPMIVIAVIRTYGTCFIVYFGLKMLNVNLRDRITYALFASLKNLAFAAIMSLSLFGEKAALPSSIAIMFEASIPIFMSFLISRVR